MSELGGVRRVQGGSGKDLSVGGMKYKVQKGQKLQDIIGQVYGLTEDKQISEAMRVVAQRNGIKNPDNISAEMDILLPGRIKLQSGKVIGAEWTERGERPSFII